MENSYRILQLQIFIYFNPLVEARSNLSAAPALYLVGRALFAGLYVVFCVVHRREHSTPFFFLAGQCFLLTVGTVQEYC